MIISVLGVGIIKLIETFVMTSKIQIPFWIVLLLGLPVPLFRELFSISEKSFVEYTYMFLLGYFIFADNKVIDKTEKYCFGLLSVGLVSALLNVYLFIWSDKEYALLNTIARFVAEWFMILALIGLAKRYLDFTGKVSSYMNSRSFLFYIYHFICVVLFEYLLYEFIGNYTFILFAGTIVLSYVMTFICCEISIRIPFLCILTGTKYKKN